MSPGYIPFHPNPSKPKYVPPPGAVDAHCHVFGPESKFPYAPERKYTPCDAPKEKLFALRDFLGFDKNVIVQASCHAKDNRALIDALASSAGKAKGVAFVGEEITDAELKAMDSAGVRGVRFNFVRRLVDFTPREMLDRIAARVAPLGWHLQFYTPGAIVRDSMDMLAELEIEFVVDHMGYMLAKDGLTEDDFGRMLDLLRDGHCWLKLSAPYRLARHSSLEAVDRVASAIVAAAPQKVLWGSDWPHIPEGGRDTGELLNALATWAPDAATRRMILVDNPRQLFDFAKVLVE